MAPDYTMPDASATGRWIGLNAPPAPGEPKEEYNGDDDGSIRLSGGRMPAKETKHRVRKAI
jgi:hypothetical protein